jgi:two-component system cell cycle response regulator
LKKLTETDGLTGLFNRRFIFELMELLVRDSHAEENEFSVIMLDLDDFKKLNDTHGHVFGDRVLEVVARTIQGYARGSDIAGRYGGEEFLVILPGTGLEAAAKVAERIRQGVSELKFDIPGVKVTISGGVARFDGDTPTSLVERADKLLYKAKRGGKNRIER